MGKGFSGKFGDTVQEFSITVSRYEVTDDENF